MLIRHIYRMKWKQLVIVLCFILFSSNSFAQQGSEGALVAKLFNALQRQHFETYEQLYASSDSLCAWVLQYADVNSESYRKMYSLRNNVTAKENYDTLIRREVYDNFDAFLKQAKMLGVHWKETVFVRYELEKMRRGSGLLVEKITPLRFLGYVFFKDKATRKMYGFTVYDLMQVNEKWYGGVLGAIYPAENKEQFRKALAKEKQRLRDIENGIVRKDSTDAHGEAGEDTRAANQKEILDRKLYKGSFDNEIEVQLYLRSIKGACPGGVCTWDALFKFGDQEEWVPMSVTRSADGAWLFTEEIGGMELKLEGGDYHGTWAAGDTKAEYDVLLKEVNLSAKKAENLDAAMAAIDQLEE